MGIRPLWSPYIPTLKLLGFTGYFYNYALVRTDIPLADQLVQVGHVCLEAGKRFSLPEQPCHLVLVTVASEEHLLQVVARIEMSGIRCALFYEPDDRMGYTAACTEAIQAQQRRLFRSFQLWSSKGVELNELAPIRGPP